MSGKNPFAIAGRTALVTGGGSGIGRRVALAFAENGASVFVTDIDPEAAEGVLSELVAGSGNHAAAAMDVSDPVMVMETVEVAVKRYGSIDILFNNAGINIRCPALEVTLEDWNRVVSTNLTGMFLCAQGVGRVMVEQGKGKIVNTASVSGKLGHPGNLAYAAAKHGVIGMTKVMAVEWGRFGVNINCIGPGVVRTPMTRPAFEDKDRYEEMAGMVPLGRLGEPEDLLGAVIFLSSDASDYITGQTFYVDGGRTCD